MRIASALLSCWLFAAPCLAAPATPKDFAYGLELAGEGERALDAFTLPEQVLRALTSRELGDLCVFDARGEQLAHGFARTRDEAPASELALSSYFPLESERREATGDVEVTVQRDDAGAITHAYSRQVVTADTRVSGYLIDLSKLIDDHSYDALTLPLEAQGAFTVELVIEASDDLNQFRPVTRDRLARLERDGELLLRETVSLPETRARYLRVSFLDPPHELALKGVRVRVRPLETKVERAFVSLAGAPVPDDSGAQLFSFALRGAFRPDRYAVTLPASTKLIEAELESAAKPEGPFRTLDRALFRQGGAEQRALASEDAFFRLRVAAQGGGVHGGAPALRLGYVPPRLLLASAGTGPYTLAYGSSQARCKQFDDTALRGPAQTALPERDTLRVVRGKELAGPSALTKTEPRSLRVFVLWGVLLIAVGVLALVARKLVRKV